MKPQEKEKANHVSILKECVPGWRKNKLKPLRGQEASHIQWYLEHGQWAEDFWWVFKLLGSKNRCGFKHQGREFYWKCERKPLNGFRSWQIVTIFEVEWLQWRWKGGQWFKIQQANVVASIKHSFASSFMIFSTAFCSGKLNKCLQHFRMLIFNLDVLSLLSTCQSLSF